MSKFISDDFAEFAEEDRERSYDEKDLCELAKLANKQLEIERQIKELESKLDDAKRDLFTLSAQDIPAAMDEIGMSEFLLKSGERIKVRRVIKASIPAKHKEAAFLWLRENNAGSLIKNDVVTSFGKGEDQKAIKLVALLQKRGLNVRQKEAVHANTLSAFCREQIERGVDLPQELLGVFEYMETKVTKA